MEKLVILIFLTIPLLIFSSPDSTAVCKDYGDDSDIVCAYCSEDKKDFTGNPLLEKNLTLLLESLASDTSSTGFNTSTVGQFYGRALCRGDAKQITCQDCVENAGREILDECENSREAIIWNDLCEVHYSFQKPPGGAYAGKYPSRNSQEKNLSEPEHFEEVLMCLMHNLSGEAASSQRMFATGEVRFSGKTVYGLVQCSRDISTSRCSRCLNSALTDLNGCCSSREGGAILSGDCNVRFGLDLFYSASRFQVTCPFPKGKKGKLEMIVVVPCVLIFVVAFLIGCCLVCFCWKKNKQKDLERSDHALLTELTTPRRGVTKECHVLNSQELQFMDLATVRAATNYFADANKIGQGGFGTVYKGVLPNGREVAVKRLSRKSWQGLEEFKNEILLIAKLQHRNLVRLVGGGIDEEEKLLVYEFMLHKSLDIFIFDSEKRSQLDWKTRHNIIFGIARGLLYLHEDSRLRIIHRDLKPSNVLLDGEMVAKISDFGIARIFSENQNTVNTKRVVGTYGYMAPEYAMEGVFSVKSDVFSFGVIVLEIISGKKNSRFYQTGHAQSLLRYAWQLWKEGKELEVVDPWLIESCSTSEVVQCIHIGLLCVQENPADRPTMSSVVAMLSGESECLPQPRPPATSIGRTIPIDQPAITNLSEKPMEPILDGMLFFLSFANGEDPTYLTHVCSNRTTFTANTPYQANLNSVLSALSTGASYDTGFDNASAGQRPESVYGFFLCRGDIKTEACRDCVVFAVNNSLKLCPFVKQAVLYYDQCLLRFTNRALFSTVDTSDGVYMWGSQDVSDNQGRFRELVTSVMRAAASEAAISPKKLAARKANYTRFQTIYSLVQCTPDLSSVDCNRCLIEIVNQLPTGKQGARMLTPSCTARREFFAFYNESLFATPTAAPAALPPRARPPGKHDSKILIVAITAPIAVSAVLLVIAYCFLVRSWRQKYNVSEENVESEVIMPESLQLKFATIEAATDKFSENNKLGAGGFGEVYKGILPNGQDIAVKRLSKQSCQGAEEFKNEILLVAKLQHRNLVRFLGFCLEGDEKILIYEFVPNKSLNNFLYDPQKQGQLDWSRRYRIIMGIARGLLYLHEESRLKVIHRDLKASNILLDAKMDPKISDFGIARIFGADQTQGNTKRIMGTYGYMPPEYAMHGKFSVKSDIYSFGVLILEIISGKNNTNFYKTDGSEDLPSYAWKLWRNGRPLEILDCTLRGSYSRREVIQCMQIGLLCLQEDPADRPSMATIVLVLNGCSVTLSTPKQPAFILRSKGDSNMPTKTLDSYQSSGPHSLPSSTWSVNEMSITEIDPR